MKVSGNGKAKVLNPAEIKSLFTELQKNPRDAALFAICFFTGCRISEALQLHTSDIVEGEIIFRKSTTKGKLKSRTMSVVPALARFLEAYQPRKAGPLFPGQLGRNQYMSRNTADRILRSACERCGIKGVSTHSFRRTALTHMNNEGVPLRTIQEISGHNSLSTLQKYLEVTPEQVKEGLYKIDSYF